MNTTRHHRRAAAAAALFLAIGAPAMAQGKGAGPKLAQETVKLLSTQEAMLVTAVRQKDSRGGAEDFRRFILQPVEDMQSRWAALPREVRLEHIHCATALQEFANFASDSFKAGRIGQPTSLYKESLPVCKKG